MASYHVLIPVMHPIRTLFHMKDYQVQDQIPLSGLVYKGISMTMIRTSSNADLPNEKASKIVAYHMNPCLIYDTSITSDTILNIRIDTNAPIMKDLPKDRSQQVEYLLSLLESIATIKDTKVIPPELNEWCTERLQFLSTKVGTEKAKEHLVLSMNSYGHLTTHQ